MDSKSREYLDKLLTRRPEDLNDYEKGFLKARRSYLTKAQLEEYDSVINPVAPLYVSKKDQTSETETVKQNARKSH
jgi:hypothetical protein